LETEGSEHNITRVVQCGQRVETQQCRQTGTTGKRKMASKTLPVLSDATEARRNLAMLSGTRSKKKFFPGIGRYGYEKIQNYVVILDMKKLFRKNAPKKKIDPKNNFFWGISRIFSATAQWISVPIDLQRYSRLFTAFAE
jgi:hypothetical protein